MKKLLLALAIVLGLNMVGGLTHAQENPTPDTDNPFDLQHPDGRR